MWWFNFHFGLSLVLHLVGIFAGAHALLTKRDPRAALGWALVCVFIPLGFVIYLIFGINRLSAKARRWETRGWELKHDPDMKRVLEAPQDAEFREQLLASKTFQSIKITADKICKGRLHEGCSVKMLVTGDEAYPDMLNAIRQAKRSVYMASYIFSAHGIGHQFIQALAEAKTRGVEVKVLIDGVGGLYSWPTAYRRLRQKGVNAAEYLPPLKNGYSLIHLNLRNHRKLLVVDGQVGFTGGMNIHSHNMSKNQRPPKIQDVHFRVEGPVVGFMQDVFLKAWYFSTQEAVKPVVYYDQRPKGNALCRGIASGPHHPYPQLERVMIAAVNAAQKRVRVMTPYFLVGAPLGSAFNAAALRGVEVEVILPEANNLSFVKGATESILPALLHYGVKFYYRQGDFAHTKLLVVDDECAFIGSSNLDIRSLHLNFEFNLEVYDKPFLQQLNEHFKHIKQFSRPITQDWLNSRGLWRQFQNAFYKLFSLYM